MILFFDMLTFQLLHVHGTHKHIYVYKDFFQKVPHNSLESLALTPIFNVTWAVQHRKRSE